MSYPIDHTVLNKRRWLLILLVLAGLVAYMTRARVEHIKWQDGPPPSPSPWQTP